MKPNGKRLRESNVAAQLLGGVAQEAQRLQVERDHLHRIILGLFNPLPDGHPKGCLANENGPCQCGYSEVAGKYLWALREAKKIAGEHYGKVEVEAAPRLKEPREMLRLGNAPSARGRLKMSSQKFDPDSDTIADLVAPIPEPTPEQIEAGRVAVDAYYDGTKDGSWEGSLALAYRAMKALEPR